MDPVIKVLLAFGIIILSLIILVVTVGVLTNRLPLEIALTVLAGMFTGVLAGIGAAKFTKNDSND